MLVFNRLFGRDREGEAIAAAVYGRLVAAARQPALYQDLGVPDTVSGRFEMVVLHLVLVLERLRAGGRETPAEGQAVFDAFCADMDRSLREMGVGDLAMSKRMRSMAEGFYGRAAAYGPLLEAGDTAGLAEALSRNLEVDGPDVTQALARYAIETRDWLARTPTEAVRRAEIRFPAPARHTGVGANP